MPAEQNAKSRAVYEHLDTSFVNLAALLRYLQQRAFVGRIHVLLDEYEAWVSLDGSAAPRVREINHATGRQSEGDDALPRLLVRSREPGGLINVYEGTEDETGSAAATAAAAIERDEARASDAAQALTPEEMEWRDLLRLSGEVVAAVERATLSAQADFAAVFRAARLELADDFPFLDPSTRRFEYAHATVRLHVATGAKTYLAGLCECLRRVVEKTAKGAQARRLRERVALELAILARRRQSQLARFKLAQQFDRIAGTRVL